MHFLRTTSAHETHALGVALGRAAFPGAVFALIGDLGAGKTSLTRGIAEGLGITSGVSSPTFVLLAVHGQGRHALYHADLYRVVDADDLVTVGIADAQDGVLVVEWADRFASALPEDRLDIALSGDGDCRDITLSARGPRHQPLEVVRA